MALRKLTAKQLTELTKKTNDNFVIITLGYSDKYILPLTDALPVIAAMKNIEVYIENYNEKPKILSIDREVKFELMGHQKYIDTKTAMLLNVTIEELEKSRENDHG